MITWWSYLCANIYRTLNGCFYCEGYFDVRDRNEAWIRIWVKKGAMIVLPAGIYHRFTLDSDNYIKVMQIGQSFCLLGVFLIKLDYPGINMLF